MMVAGVGCHVAIVVSRWRSWRPVVALDRHRAERMVDELVVSGTQEWESVNREDALSVSVVAINNVAAD